MTTAASQQAFVNLRKRLDQLGYRQPLGIESLPLVEKLFADLLHTTDSLKRLKLDFSRVPEEKATAEVFIEPYKSDNAKLVRENNELHQELIKHKEETEALVRGSS
jgi:centrosomal protein CEP135